MSVPIHVHVDQVGGTATPDSLALVAHVAAVGATPRAVTIGRPSSETCDALGAQGCDAVIAYEPREATAATDCADAICDLVARSEQGCWLAPTTTVTTEAAAVAAARCGAGLLWRLADVVIDERGDGAAVTGTQLSTDGATARPVNWTTPWRLGLVRPPAISAGAGVRSSSPRVEHRLLPDPFVRRALVIEQRPTAVTGTDLARAEVVVAGGRGLGSRDRLDQIRELADLLGGTAGVSLPLVEAGWAPRSMQVGQTGTRVTPRVYLAFGISGQVQHRVGMERSGAIVAVNTDPQAPIMSFCDLAVVADAGAVLPELIAALRGVRSC